MFAETVEREKGAKALSLVVKLICLFHDDFHLEATPSIGRSLLLLLLNREVAAAAGHLKTSAQMIFIPLSLTILAATSSSSSAHRRCIIDIIIRLVGSVHTPIFLAVSSSNLYKQR